jgi:twitching motility two-component system response regulator PilG
MTSPVWIIDGSQVARTILKITLRREGIASTCYSEGSEALRDLWELPGDAPGLMLIEGQLPDMDGYDVIMQVRRLLSRRQTAIVVLSNRSGMLDRLRGRLSGADDSLTKPFLVADVRDVVGKHLQRVGRWPATTPAADTEARPVYQ